MVDIAVLSALQRKRLSSASELSSQQEPEARFEPRYRGSNAVLACRVLVWSLGPSIGIARELVHKETTESGTLGEACHSASESSELENASPNAL